MGEIERATELLKEAEAVLRMNRLFSTADRIRKFIEPRCPECGEPVDRHTMDDAHSGIRRLYCPEKITLSGLSPGRTS